MGAESAQPGVDWGVGELAARQYGVVSLAQLGDLGLGPKGVRKRVATGRLFRLHAGVYAVGHPALPPGGALLAAVLACGPGAFLSHRSAGHLWGLIRSSQTLVDVSSRQRGGRGRSGIRAHRGGTALRCDITVRERVPVSTVARTLLDLASVLRRDELERACERAETLGLLDVRALEDVLARATGRRGVRRLGSILAGLRPESAFTRSELERRFLALCREQGLPRPSVNVWLPLAKDGFEVDFLWEGQQVIAELDGHRFHRTRLAFERDRSRDQLLAVAGYQTLRFTWRQVVEGPGQVAGRLGALLARRSDLRPRP